MWRNVVLLTMLVMLPLFAFFILWAFRFSSNQCQGNSFPLRTSFLESAVIWSVLLVFITEATSFLHLFNRPVLVVCWLSVCAILLLILFKTRSVRPDKSLKPFAGKDKNEPAGFFDRLLFYCAVTIILLTGVTAFFAAPNNWDSMTYHLGRVVHWVQNQSANHFPTHIDRQVTQPPGAEFIIAHFYILSDSDRLANLVQWFALVGCAVASSLCAALLGGERKVQILTAALVVSIPMVILQASSTQNDLVVSFWILTTFAFILKWKKYVSQNRQFFYIFSAIGLALLTKGTAYIFLVPIVVWMAFLLARNFKKISWINLVFCGMLVLLLNGGHFYRNMEIYKTPLGHSYKLTNEKMGLMPLLSNAVRNVALHCKTPSREVNTKIEDAFVAIYQKAGLDINDPTTTWHGSFSFNLQTTYNHEDYASNPFHLLLICVSFFALLAIKELRRSKELLAYAAIICGSFLLFCLVLKWQIWHPRLHLPMFVLAMPFCALVFSKLRFGLAVKSLVAVTVLYGFVFVFDNDSRKLLENKNNIFTASRMEQYFVTRRNLKEPYRTVAELLKEKELSRLGLVLGGDSWEYPLWQLLKDTKKLRIEHIDVKNKTSQAKGQAVFRDFLPEAIMTSKWELAEKDSYTFDGKNYHSVYQRENINLFVTE